MPQRPRRDQSTASPAWGSDNSSPAWGEDNGLARLRARHFEEDAMTTALRWGQPAPAFSLPSTLGRPVSLEEHRGKDVVLAFYCYDWGSI
jgi:hypothetical protein